MSKGEAAPEPSMDEILSSIRKIIAEDEVETPPTTATPPTAGAPAGDAEDDDILELTEDDEEAPAEPSSDAAPGDAVIAFENEDEDEEPATAAEEPVTLLEEAPMEPAPQIADPGPRADPAADLAALTEHAAEALLDTGTATAAGGALQRLSAAMTPGAAIPQGDRTIEAFLADLVRPELKSWLDEHLPGLVERIVEREIRKLVRDAQPE